MSVSDKKVISLSCADFPDISCCSSCHYEEDSWPQMSDYDAVDGVTIHTCCRGREYLEKLGHEKIKEIIAKATLDTVG